MSAVESKEKVKAFAGRCDSERIYHCRCSKKMAKLSNIHRQFFVRGYLSNSLQNYHKNLYLKENKMFNKQKYSIRRYRPTSRIPQTKRCRLWSNTKISSENIIPLRILQNSSNMLKQKAIKSLFHHITFTTMTKTGNLVVKANK
ncbi:hypothetical protein ICE98_02441 [Lactococcus lactis]|nr:hypothetical protein [Lactococcus lactis]